MKAGMFSLSLFNLTITGMCPSQAQRCVSCWYHLTNTVNILFKYIVIEHIMDYLDNHTQ